MKHKYNEASHSMVFKKLGMSTFNEHFDENNTVLSMPKVVPVTILEYLPTKIIKAGNYYHKAFVSDVGPKLSKPNKGQLIKNNILTPKKGMFLQLRGKALTIDQNNIIELNNLNIGDIIDVQGTSKGKGFAGVMKRYNFKGGRASHGASASHREMGSTGSQDIGHVDKGKKMPGRHGHGTVTMHNLKIIYIDYENNTMAVKGSVPGVNKGIVKVRNAIKCCKNQNPWANNPLALEDLKGSK